MSKLIIETEGRKPQLKKLLSAVYIVLKQKHNLKAELVFMSNDEIKELNNRTRGKNAVTDVLSYPSLDNIRGKVLQPKNCKDEIDGKYIFIGSIVVCEDKIREQAKELGHSFTKERNYLIVHGLMHLFGYDHENDKDKKLMRTKEKAVFALLKKGEK